jgi:DNA-binding NarL/FixJ family response regulator
MIINVIAVDDEPASLEYIKRCCSSNKKLNLLFTTTNPLDAKTFIENNSVDLLITDLNMNVLSGIELSEVVKDKCVAIFITGYTSNALDAIGRNAVEILMKPFSAEAFGKAIDKAKKIIDYDLAKKENKALKLKLEVLSETEKKLLLAIGQRKSNKEIGNEFNISVNTLDTHKNNIKNKIGLKNSQELLIFAYELLKIS